jgi:hypothetical protein|tara:strand:+ start:45022 stop:45585 length:564 start_codon:yes stop_codon:yes gene_type:complete
MEQINFLNIEYIYYQLHLLFTEGFDAMPEGLAVFWEWFTAVSTIASLILATIIIYATIRLRQIRKMEEAELNIPIKKEDSVGVQNEKWSQIVSHAASGNPNDWRHAVLDADIVLDEAITKMGYQGDGLGEKLKQVKSGELQTLQSAWEAHKVRNALAHEGSDFVLTQREARRVIDLYRQVLEELNYL